MRNHHCAGGTVERAEKQRAESIEHRAALRLRIESLVDKRYAY
jgi:hypothetical protein